MARARRLSLTALVAGLALAAAASGGLRHAAGGCAAVTAPAPRPAAHLRPPHSRLAAAQRWVATVETSCGSFHFSLDVKDSPRTAASFAALAGRGYFDRTIFHRIVPGFVIQAGDPTESGDGGPGYLTLDVPPRSATYRLGTVAMAKTALEPAGTSGSQFFVVTAADAGLPPDYALLGHVTSGLAVVERIGRLGQASGVPARTVLIRRIRVAAQ